MGDLDTKRKGRTFWCDNCAKTTRFIPAGKNDVVLRKDANGRTQVSKLQHFVCKECGHSRMINKW